MTINLVNNFIFGDGTNFTFGDDTNFIFGENIELSQDAQDLIEYYTNLLIIQYHDKPKAQATIQAVIAALVADGVIFDIRDGYDIETAVGAQLDILAKYIGVNRFYEGQVLSGFFAFTNYDEFSSPTGIGFADYTNYESKVGDFLTYNDLISETFELPDADLRFLLKLKIIINSSNFSHGEIDSVIYEFFGDNLRPASDGNMQMAYFYKPSMFELVKVARDKGLLPKPMGVGLNYLIAENSWFGFTTYNEFETPGDFKNGFSNYSDYDTKEGELLQYSNLIE